MPFQEWAEKVFKGTGGVQMAANEEVKRAQRNLDAKVLIFQGYLT